MGDGGGGAIIRGFNHQCSMTREIKFRAWNFKKKEMFPVDLIAFNLDGSINFARSVLDELRTVEHTPTTCKILQYTGLKDVNGKEIYEGDIVQWDEQIADSTFQMTDVIESLRTAYEFEGSEETETWRVIGNIFKNPKLLKV